MVGHGGDGWKCSVTADPRNARCHFHNALSEFSWNHSQFLLKARIQTPTDAWTKTYLISSWETPWTSRWIFPWEESWWHSQVCQPPQGLWKQPDMVRQSCGDLCSSCSTFCSENGFGSCLLRRRVHVFAVCHWSVSRAHSEGRASLLPVEIVPAVRAFRTHHFKPATEKLAWFIFSCLCKPSQ